MSNKIAVLEVILFTYGEAMSVKELAKRLGISLEECENLLAEYEQKLKTDESRGLTLIQNNGKVQLTTKPEFQKLIEEFIKEEFREKLTPAALEVLAIVAYLGPLPRSIIDQIRGVNSNFILRSLLVRGLLDREINPQKGNVYLYNISNDSLRHLGLTRKEELPEFQNYKDILERFTVQETTPENN